MCDRVAVMYAGEIVEQADVATLFRDPKHPYTQGLIGSIPVMGIVRDELATIPGNVPNLISLPEGCRFAPRCFAREPFGVDEQARTAHPELHELPDQAAHTVRCWIYHGADGRPTGKLGPKPPTEAAVPEAVLTPAPTLPGDVVVPETRDDDERRNPPDDDARYRRPTDALPVILGSDDAPSAPTDDPHQHPRS
jgi:oligopeptide/dipeptide ABC transporter ATP-binding protein